jgi:hypothetical protein
MKRRDFIKAISALVGAAAITPTFAKSLPKVIPDDWHVSLHSASPDGVGGEVSYTEYARIQIPRHDVWNQKIEFPEYPGTGSGVITHVGVNGAIFPLDRRVTLSANIAPMFLAGALRVTED